MGDVFEREAERRRRALAMVRRLRLLERWSRVGSPELVGAVRRRFVVRRDIDMEVYTDVPKIHDGFSVLAEIACEPGVRSARFANELTGEDQGLYFQVRCLDEQGESWKIDCWLLANDHPQAHWGERFARALERVQTEETRRTILELKEALEDDRDVHGIDVYRAVLDGGVRDVAGLRAWMKAHTRDGLDLWLPGA